MKKHRNAISFILIIIIVSSLSFAGCENNDISKYEQKKRILIELPELKALFLENEKLLTDTVKSLEEIPAKYSFKKEDRDIVSYEDGIKSDYEISDTLYTQLSLCFDAMETKINPQFKGEYSMQIGYGNTYEGPYIFFDFASDEILYVLAYSETIDFESESIGIGIKDGWYYYDFASV